MSLGRALASLGAVGAGWVKGDQMVKDQEAAAAKDQRDQETHDARMAEIRQQQQLQASLAAAATPASVTPSAQMTGLAPDGRAAQYDDADLAQSDARESRVMADATGTPAPQLSMANSGYSAGLAGSGFADQASAQRAASTYNSPEALSQRQVGLYQAAGRPSDALDLQNKAQIAADLQWKRQLGGAMQEGFGGLEKMINSSEAGPMKGRQVKFVPSADGSSMVLNTVGTDGSLSPTTLAFPNDSTGPVMASYALDKTVTPAERYDHWVSQQQAAAKLSAEQAKMSEDARHHREDEKNHAITAAAAKQRADQGENVASGMTDAAVENAAARYNVDGTLPPMGMGMAAAGLRAKILNRAAERTATSGMSPEEIRIWQTGNAANKSALTKLENQAQMVSSFEKTFSKNADMVDQLSAQVDRTGTPVLNRWIQSGKRSIAGDPALSQFDVAVKSTANEFAKIVSGGMGNSPTAEGEIKKINDLLNTAQTPEQVTAVLNTMRQETQNRLAGFDEQRKSLLDRMKMPNKAAGAGTGGAAAAPAPAPQAGAKVGGFVFKGGDPTNRANWELAK